MFTPITFPTALFFWLTYDNNKSLQYLEKLPGELSKTVFHRNSLLASDQEYSLQAPLHIMVPKDSLRHHGPQFICHVMPQNLPEGSFVQLTGSTFIISPELCFLLSANYLSIPELTVLACDLCGIYAHDERAEYSQISRRPVTSSTEIKNYLNKTRRIDGITKARIAARYAIDNSNSPMESKLVAACVLRYLYGGYGFEKPELNYNVQLSPAGIEVIGLDHLCCDIVWPSKRLIVEYDSDLAHFNKRRFYFDKKRTTALILSDYSVITVTRDDFRNYNSMERLFSVISSSLNKRISRRDYEASYKVRRELLKELFLTTNSLDWFQMFS